jgi:hypothetical protein
VLNFNVLSYQMMVHAYTNYETYALGFDELRPISKAGRNWIGHAGLCATIIDSLDTLKIMGLEEHFQRGKAYLFKNLSFDVVSNYDISPCPVENVHLTLAFLVRILMYLFLKQSFEFWEGF